MPDLTTSLKQYSLYFNQQLSSYFLAEAGPQQKVIEAMHYSIAGGGKRLRPFLITQSAALFGINRDQALPVAIALECLHTYSLIHDDLPAMDNDDLRRGRPTCHKQFDEATAILAGDGLLTYAFAILSQPRTGPDAVRLELVNLLADAAGAFGGMISGQMLDLTPPSQLAKDQLESTVKKIEEMKTGRLLRFACEAGAVLGQAETDLRLALINYSRKIGIAFQIADDILDVEGNPDLMGKTLGKDVAQNKLTFVSLYGLETARQMAWQLINQAKQDLIPFGNKAQLLSDLADYIINRRQ